MNLKQLFDKYDCDKSSKHHYHEVYEPLLSPYKKDRIQFLEVGIFHGASTAAFDDYFKNGDIYGIDIFTRTNPDELPVLQRDSVHWVKGDSMKPDIADKVRAKFGEDISFDFILDDGAHYPLSNELTFKYLWPLLKKGGTFIIEDVWPIDIMGFDEMQHHWMKKYPDRYNKATSEAFMRTIENSGGVITRHDLRKYNPDSYVITVEKK